VTLLQTDTGNIAVANLIASTFTNANSTGVGAITLVGTGATTYAAVTTFSGSIALSATGDLTASSVTANGAGNDVSLTTTGAGSDILLGSVSAPDQVTLGSTATVVESVVDGTADVTAAILSLTAAAGANFDTDIATLTGSTTGAGDVTLDELNAGLTVSSFTLNNGAFVLNTAGTTTLTSLVSSTSNEANDLTVTASSGDLVVGTVNAGTNLGDVFLTATTGAITSSTSLVTGDLVSLTAEDGIGASGNAINTEAKTLSAVATAAGAIWLDEATGATLDNIVTANGPINVLTHGDTTITNRAGTGGVVSLTDHDDNDITIQAMTGNILVGLVDADVADNTSSGDVTIIASAGSINDLDANDDFSLDIRGDVVTVNASNGAGSAAHLDIDGQTNNVLGGGGGVGVIDLSGAAVTVTLNLSSTGDISYGTSGNILVGSVVSTAGNVSLSSFTGYIADDLDDAAVDISGATVTLSAANGIGGFGLTGGAVSTDTVGTIGGLEITSTSLVAHTTSATVDGAPIVIRETDGTTVTDVDTIASDIRILSTGGNLAVGDICAGIAASVCVGTFDVFLDAQGGAITDAGVGVQAALLTADAISGITLDTNVASLNASVSGIGGILVTEAGTIDLVDVDTFDGPITVNAGGTITATNVSAGDDDASGDGNVTLTTTSGDINVVLVNAINDALLSAAGALADGTGGDVSVGGVATLGGATITLGNDGAGNSTDFGSLTFNSAGAVVIAEDSDTNIVGSNTAGSLDLDSTGLVEDSGATDITVTNLADVLGDSITLGSVGTFQAGTLTFNSAGAVVIAEDDATDIVGINTAGSLDLDSLGAISDAGATSLVVAGLTDVNGASISLGGGDFDTTTLRFNSLGAVTIVEDSSIDLVGSNTAAGLSLNGVGIDDGAGAATVVAGGLTTLTAGAANDISLVNAANDFDELSIVSGDDATIADFDEILLGGLDGVTLGGDLIVTAGDFIGDSGDIAVTGLGSFTAGSFIVFGDVGETTTFGTLSFAGTYVQIFEDDSIDLAGANVASAGLYLQSETASIGDGTGGTDLTVTGGSAILSAATTISVGGEAGEDTFFDSLNFTGTTVAIQEDDATDLVGFNQATNGLTLTSGGAITDQFNTILQVTGDADLVGTGITLAETFADAVSVSGNASFTGDNGISIGTGTSAVDFGSLTFNSTAGDVTIYEGLGGTADGTVLTGSNTANTLTLVSTGAITDTANTDLVVDTADATLSGDSITLANDAADALSVAGNASLIGPNGISIGALGAVDFGTLTFNSSDGFVSITEDNGGAADGTVLTGSNTANSLLLASTGALTDAAGASIVVDATDAALSGASIVLSDNVGDALSVAGNASFTAAGGVTIGADGTVDFGTLTFNSSAGAVNVTEDNGGTADGTDIVGTNTADSLALTSAGAITDGAAASITVDNGAATLSGTSITLADDTASLSVSGNASFTAPSGIAIGADGLVNLGSLTFNSSSGAVNIAEDSTTGVLGTQLTGSNTADSLVLTAAGALTDATGASLVVDNGPAALSGTTIVLADQATDTLSVSGDASFAGNGGVTIGAAGTVNFGALTFNSSGGVVDITEDSTSGILGTQLTGSNTADSLILAAAGALTDATGTGVTIDNGNATVTGSSIVLADQGGDALTVSGTASFTGAAGVTIGANGLVNFGALTFNSSSGLVSITEDSTAGILGTQLTGANTADSLILVAGGALTDAAATSVLVDNGNATLSGLSIVLADSVGDVLAVNGNASLTGANGITIGAAGTVTFNSLTFNSSAGTVNITEDAGGAVPGTQLTGVNTAADDLFLTSAGAITDATGTDLNVTDVATLNGTAITLGGDTGDDTSFGFLNFTSTGAVTIDEDTATTLTGASTAGSLTLVSAGDITEFGGAVLNVAGVGCTTTCTSLTAGGNNIVLDTATNNFTGPVTIVSANDAVLDDANAITFGSVSTTGSFTVDAGGAITLGTTGVGGNLDLEADANNASGGAISGAGVVVVTGTTTLDTGTPATLANDITLDNPGNDFGGDVTIVAANDASIDDLGALSFGAVATDGNFTVDAGGDVALTGTTTVGGALDVDAAANNAAGGAITGSGQITVVTGSTTLATGTPATTTNVISLDNVDNDFGFVTVTSAYDASLDDTDDVTLGVIQTANNFTLDAGGAVALNGASTIGGNLDIDAAANGAGGSVTDNAPVTVTGTSALAAGPGFDVSLDQVDFVGAVSVVNTNNVSISDATAIDLGDFTTFGNVVIAAVGDITSGAATVLAVGDADAPLENLTLSTSGNIDLDGAVQVTGATALTANGTDAFITVDNTANDFTGAVTFAGADLEDVTIYDTTALAIQTSNTINGNLTVTATGITDSNVLTVVGTTTLDANGGTIVLDSANSDFGGSVLITDTSGVLIRDANDLRFGTSVIGGNLDAGTGPASGIFQEAGTTLTVTGTATLAAGSLASPGAIGLIEDNNFGTVVITRATDAAITDTDGLLVGTSTVTGDLTLVVNGDVTEVLGATVTVGDDTTVTATGFNVTFDSNTNAFTGAVSATAADATWHDANGLELGAHTLTGNLDATAVLGDITSSGALDVDGMTTLTASDGTQASITVDHPANDFTGPIVVNAPNLFDFAIASVSAIDLALPQVDNTLTVNALGITQSGALDIGGASLLTAGAGGIGLTDTGNDFTGLVTITSVGSVTLIADTSIALGPVTVVNGTLSDVPASDLTVQSVNGGITADTLTSPIVVDGNSSFTIGATGDIQMLNTGNNFVGSVAFTGNNGIVNLAVYDSTPLVLGASNVSGNLTVFSSDISSSGDLFVGGVATFNVITADGPVALGGTANDFGTVVVNDAGDLSIRDTDSQGYTGLTLTITNVTGSVSIDGIDHVDLVSATAVELGTVTVAAGAGAGSLTIDAAGQAVTQPVAGGLNVAGVVAIVADSVQLNSATDLNIFVLGTDNINLATVTGDIALAVVDQDVELSHITTDAAGTAAGAVSITTVSTSATGYDIEVDADFGNDTDDLTLHSSGVMLTANDSSGQPGQLSADNLSLTADGRTSDGFGMGTPNNPIIITLTDSSKLDAVVTTPDTFGFIRADGFDTSAFQDIYARSGGSVFIIGRFDEIVSGVQGSFISAAAFNVDSSQFRTDLNIFGVDGAGILLPADQCEDEESTDCAR
jgi:hypothetical protein